MIGMFDGCAALTTLDLSNFDTSNLQFMGRAESYVYGGMFGNCTNLTTIYASDKFVTSNLVNSVDDEPEGPVSYNQNVFELCKNLIGKNKDNGDDVKYSSEKISASTMANYTGGYFTYKPAPTT